jgi:spore cortex formation protein SpoVR/YcgB (stage V sporulation)
MTEQQATVEKIGTKETEEIIDFAQGLINSLAEKKADDGKISAVEALSALTENAASGAQAVWESWEATKEIKDLDKEESKRLLDKSLGVVMALVGLVIGGKK